MLRQAAAVSRQASQFSAIASRLTLVKPPKNLQAIASRKNRQLQALH